MIPISIEDRVLGCLIGAGAGDGMGAATEARTTEQIKSFFGGRVETFFAPPADTFSYGNVPGQATDDFSSAYFVIKAIIDDGGVIKQNSLKKALIEWSENEKFFDRFAGPTTRAAIQLFKEGKEPEYAGVNLSSKQATNGAAMRIAPMGLLYPNNLDKTIEGAIKLTELTHNNYLAISGACAVACAVNKALAGADLYAVIQAALYGAEKGEEYGLAFSQDVPGPRVIDKMKLALEIGFSDLSKEEKFIEIRDRIGTGLHISDTVPSAFGYIASNQGHITETIFDCVNAGYDTDTLATIAGAVVGTYNGASQFPSTYLSIIENANGFDLKALSKRIVSTYS